MVSPPLVPEECPAWEAAGFTPHTRLLLLRRPLHEETSPAHRVRPGGPGDLAEILAVDREAFPPFWRLGRPGLADALAATPRRALHLARDPEGALAGFALTGAGTTLAYLQRLAVRPRYQGRGIGRSLVRAAVSWARRRGAGALLLNTPEAAGAALSLYCSEGFRVAAADLAILTRLA